MRSDTWKRFLLVSVPIIVLYQFLPVEGLWRPFVYEGTIAASVLMVFLAARSQPPGKRAAWYWMGAGVLSFLIGDVIYMSWEPLTGSAPPYPTIGDGFYLCFPPLLAWGIRALIKARTPGNDRGSLIDASIIAIGLGVVAWVFLIEPNATNTSVSLTMRLFLVAYPALDILLLAALVRLAVGRGARPTSFYLLAAAVTTILITDALFGLQVLAGTFDVEGVLNLGWMSFYVLVAAAALHPSAEKLYEPAPVAGERLTRTRLTILACASLLAPIMQIYRDHNVGVSLTAASAALFVLVIARMAGLLRDLERSLETVAELQRRRGERRFRALVQNAADLVVVIDRKGIVTFASPSVLRFFEADPTGWQGDRLSHLLAPEDAEVLVTAFEAASKGSAPQRPLDLKLSRPDGSLFYLEIIFTDLLADPDVEGIVLTARDVTERVELEEQLRHLAFHDPVTSLPNRALFGERVTHALERSERNGDKVAVIFCDIDNFKTVNDSLGHSSGDRLLVAAAQRLSHCVRPGDTVARLGGDEFAVLLEGVSELDQVSQIADRLVAGFRESWSLDGTDVIVTISAGVAMGSDVGRAAELLRDADAAMYEAKKRGKDRWRMFQPKLHDAALARLRLAADLKRGIENDELFIEYQPVVDLETNAIEGVEALVRWRHPERGVISPGEFIPVAESSGAIVALGSWVLERACRQVAAWRQTLPAAADLTLSVNVSARQLQARGFIGTVRTALEDSGLEPCGLVLELTESILLKEPEKALVPLGELKRMGVRLAIDDFGTGYSSLSYLKRLPVDVIKIDRSFIEDVCPATVATSLAGSIIRLIETLGVIAIAEGIETSDQAEGLSEMGCRLGQGFYLHRPLSTETLVAALEDACAGALIAR